jgi:gliding motility associated protien GldN
MQKRFLTLLAFFTLSTCSVWAQNDGDQTGDPAADATTASTGPASDDRFLGGMGVYKRALHGTIEQNGTATTGVRPLEYDFVRQSDIYWQKRIWRVIDFREKMNLPFIYPKPGAKFFEIIHRAAMTSEEGLKMYSTGENDDQFLSKGMYMDTAAFKTAFNGSDTSYIPDPNTGEIDTAVIVRKIDAEKVTKMRVIEDWFFDDESSTMQVRILGICPLYPMYTSSGQFVGEIPMYWLYYPDLRKVLTKYEVYNSRNDAKPMSWDDVMENRFFSSYIYKESNVYDRRISDYANGLDALLEGERIKQDIMDKEQFLWSY